MRRAEQDAFLERCARIGGAAIGDAVFSEGTGLWVGQREVAHFHSRDTLEIWRIPDHGVSTEGPMLRIAAPLGRQAADTGIALDPVHKEVIIATSGGNSILTFSVPEVFDRPAPTPSR